MVLCKNKVFYCAKIRHFIVRYSGVALQSLPPGWQGGVGLLLLNLKL